MAIPKVNVTVTDGALGIIQPSTANVQAKLGVCSLGSASVAASHLYGSTTGGDGVTFTAVTPGAQGNLISITIAAPAGGSTTVVVAGNSITVNPKSGAINSDIVTAVAGSAAATLVTGVATGAGDVVIAVAATPLAGGISGTNNTIFSLTDPTAAVAALGQGPLTEAVAHSLAVAGGVVLAVPVNASVAGVAGAVTHVGAGAGTVAVAGAPYDAYSVVLKCVLGGALGTATFTYSLDGGTLVSPVLTIPAGGTYAIQNTNLTLTFASTFTAGDSYIFSCSAPSYSLSDLQAAFTGLTADPRTWGWAHVVGQQASVSAAKTVATGVDTIMTTAFGNYRYCFAVVESPADTDANLISGWSGFASTRTMVCARTATLVSSINGTGLNRSSAWPVTARMALAPISEDLGYVARGSLPGITALQGDEGVLQSLDGLNFTTLRTIVGRAGFYVTTGHMFAAAGSDYLLSQNRRVMDQACTVSRAGLLNFLNSSLRVKTGNGNIFEADAQNIEAYVGGQLNASILAPGYCSGTSLVVNRTNNILSSQQLLVTTRITPLGYAKDIEESIGFFNPVLQVQAAS